MTIQAYAAAQAKAPLKPFKYDPTPLGPDEVEVAITHCGICHSDVHLIDNDWGTSTYPLVPGHEIIGTIKSVGENVKDLKLNQRVGIGWQRSACMVCEWCKAGKENLCAKQQATCVGHYGGFADTIQTDSRFVFAIPDALDSENAAPLLCGGITVYTPLHRYIIKPSMQVGIIGIGGLGHLALQFAHAMNAEVTAFSTSPEKEAEAKSFGAHHFVLSNNPKQMKKVANSFDLILSTANANLDWDAFVACLRPQGILCFVGLPLDKIEISPFGLIVGQKTICGSPIGNRHDIKTMLDFAAKHNIKAKTDLHHMRNANKALDIVRNNDARYRLVLENK